MNFLRGIRVIDLSSLMAGPYCSMLLADMGAEVIKVEHPKEGDPVRRLGPPFTKGESCLFLSLNRNKKGITLDLSQADGQETLYRLVEKSDVLLENFIPKMAERMGVSYEKIAKAKPDIVYCCLSAFGENGELKNKPGTDPIFQGMGGIMTINGSPDDPPIRLGFPVADIAAGVFAAFAIAAALLFRERSGKGQKVDISIFHAMVALQTPRVAEFLSTGKNPERLERSSAFATPSQYFDTLDGYINVSAFSNKFWKRLCKVLELESLGEQEEFSTPEKRMVNKDLLLPIFEEVFRKKKTAEWMKVFEEEDIPHGPIYTYEQMFGDEALEIAQYLVEFLHPIAGKMKSMGGPIQPWPPERVPEGPPPLHGEHTQEVLTGFGFTGEEIDQMKKARVI
jgi:crotonobetainyl-CoA:carnitine CoA-transferase CaiB-like acyl-CoA transferase